MKIYITIPAIAVGTLVGMIGSLYLIGFLEEMYRPVGIHSTDMPIWLLIPMAVGAILGGITVSAICSHINKHYLWASIKCILTGILLSFLLANFVDGFRSPLAISDIRYTLACWGPFFVWCSALFIYGLFLLYKSYAQKSWSVFFIKRDTD